MNALTARELADRFTLEQLRDAFDAIPTVNLLGPMADLPLDIEIGGYTIRTTGRYVGAAKLLHRPDLFAARPTTRRRARRAR